MKIVKLDKNENYKEMCSIWEKRNFPKVDKSLLSDFIYGVYHKGILTAFCSLYLANGAKICWTGFPTTNPDVDKDIRGEALDDLFITMMNIAKKMGYSVIMTTTGTKQIEERLTKLNFTLTDEKVGLYFRGL